MAHNRNVKSTVESFLADKEALEADPGYTEEGRAKRIRKIYEDQVAPALD